MKEAVLYAPVRSSPRTNQRRTFFIGRMPFLLPNQQLQNSEGRMHSRRHGECTSLVIHRKDIWSVKYLTPVSTKFSFLKGLADLFCRLSWLHSRPSCAHQGAPWSWKVVEFRRTIFQAWKVIENSKGHGKSWKSHGK